MEAEMWVRNKTFNKKLFQLETNRNAQSNLYKKKAIRNQEPNVESNDD